jgi:hypothetical protein
VKKWSGVCVVVGLAVGLLILGAYVFAGGQVGSQNEPNAAQAQSGTAPADCSACPCFVDRNADGVCDVWKECHPAGQPSGSGLCHRSGGQVWGCQRRGPCH